MAAEAAPLQDAHKKPPSPRRRPSGGGYARGEETRARIVDAAMKVFGEDGYEGASTRRIAEVAGVKPPALQYYFDSKAGLHRACAELIISRSEGLFATLEDVEARLDREGPAMAVDGACAILDALLVRSFDIKPMPGERVFVARAQADGYGPALDLIHARLIRPLQTTMARLVAAAHDRQADADEVKLTSAMLLAQISAFHTTRAKTLAYLDWPDFDGERRELIRRRVRLHTRAIMEAKPY